MKTEGDYHWDRTKEGPVFDLGILENVIDLVRIEWLDQLQRLALNIHRAKSMMDRKVLDSLPNESDIRLENIRRLHSWYDELRAIKDEADTTRGQNGAS